MDEEAWHIIFWSIFPIWFFMWHRRQVYKQLGIEAGWVGEVPVETVIRAVSKIWREAEQRKD